MVSMRPGTWKPRSASVASTVPEAVMTSAPRPPENTVRRRATATRASAAIGMRIFFGFIAALSSFT
jgi:hypothetical protein